MKTIATQKFQDPEGNLMYLRVVTGGKQVPFLVRVEHVVGDTKKTGVLGHTSAEKAAIEKLEALAAQAVADGWVEVLGRQGRGLTELPKPVLRPVTRPQPVAAGHAGGGSRRAAARR